MHSRRSFLKWAAGLNVLAASAGQAAAPSRDETRRLEVLLFDRAEIWEFLRPEMRKALAEVGWIEGTNLVVRWNHANGDAERLSALAAAIVRSSPDAILTRGTPATQALQRATTTIPILTGLGGDPVTNGFAKTLAAPGSNITGISYAVDEQSRKQVELLRAMVPNLATLLVVITSDRAPFLDALARPFEAAAREAGLVSRIVLIADADALQAAFRRDSSRRDSAAFVFGLPAVEPKVVVDLALAAGIPTMFEQREYVELGGLASYRFYWDNQAQRTAEQIDKVFRGAKPAQIPFELPTRSEFVVNRKTAKALGLVLSPALILRADAVVE